MVMPPKPVRGKNVPKIDNEGAHGTAAFDDVRGDVVREMIEDDLMGKEFSNKWWGHVVPWCLKCDVFGSALISHISVVMRTTQYDHMNAQSGCT